MPRQLTDSRFRLTEHQRQEYRASIEAGTSLAEVCDPDYWRVLSRTVKAGDMIEASWEDGAAWFLLYVRAAPGMGRLLVEPVAGRMFVDEDEDAPRVPLVSGAANTDEQDGLRVEYVGDHDLWRVVLIAEGRVLKDKLPTQSEARRQRTNYLKTLGRQAA